MKLSKRSFRNRNGAMLPMVAVALLFFFVAAFFAIDMSRMHLVRSELRTATDAAARAAVEALGRTESEDEAIRAAINIARANIVNGQGLQLDPSEIVLGFSEQNADGSFSFTSGAGAGADPDQIASSAQVQAELAQGSPNGPVRLFFGGFFGVPIFETTQSATATRLDRDIAMVLDKSGSMALAGRFNALLNGVSVFVDELAITDPEEYVSLVAYDTLPRKLLDLTDDLPAIRDSIGREVPGGRTGIGRAMRVGLDSVLNDPEARKLALKSMIVMTDGNQNEGITPLIVADECRDANVVVHTITFSSGADEALMREVARRTGGTHLHATNDQQLIDAFRVIARQLQVLLIE